MLEGVWSSPPCLPAPRRREPLRRAARAVNSRRFAPGSGAEKALESRLGGYPPPAIQDEHGEHREQDIPQRIPRPAVGALAAWEDAAPTTAPPSLSALGSGGAAMAKAPGSLIRPLAARS